MERAVALNPPSPREKRRKHSIGTEKTRLGGPKDGLALAKTRLGGQKFLCYIIYGDRDLFWFVQARPRPYFFGAGIVGAYFLLAQQNSGTEFSTLEKIWSRSIFDIQTRPRGPCCGTGFGVKCNRRVPGGTRVAFCLSKLRGLRVP